MRMAIWTIAGLMAMAVCFGASAAEPQAGDSVWLPRAQEVTQHLQKTFWDETKGLYKRSITDANVDFMWPNGVAFSALVAATRYQPDVYCPVLDRFFKSMDRYWDTKVKIPGYEPAPTKGNGRDKYYDDNAWMVITYLEAFEATNDRKFLTRADETLRFVLSGWDEQLGGGIWWHEAHKDGTKNTCINAPAAYGCLRMAKFQETAPNIEWATKLVAWTCANLQDKDGLFEDRKVVATGEIKRGKLTYNTALMVRALQGLYAHTKKAEFLDEAKRIAKTADALLSKKTGAYRDDVKWSHLMVEADLELYRLTQEPYLLERAKKNGEHYYATFKKEPPKEMMHCASIARMLWLLADAETPAGQAFWKRADQVKP